MQRKYFVIFFLMSLLCSGQNPGVNSNQSSSNPSRQLPVSSRLPAPYYQADFSPLIANGHHVAIWDKGHLVGFDVGEMKEPVTVYDKTGKWLFENPLNFENAIKVYGHDAAVTPSGTIVIAAAAATADGAVADLIAEVGKEGIRRVVRTSPFRVLKLCVTQEGTVWAYGEELTDDRRAERRARYPMLREYSLEKGELRSELDRITLRPPKGVPLDGARGEFQMRCDAGKVVIVSGLTNELMEYDLASSKLSRWSIAPLPENFYINGAALSDSGEVYVSTFRPGQNAQTGILHLHMNSAGTIDWTALTLGPFSGGKIFLLLGSDGEDLVYAKGRAAPTLFWSKAMMAEMAR